MHDDIDAEIDRPLKIRRHKRVVANDLRTARMGQFGNRLEIGDGHYRVCRRLDKDHLRIRLKRLLEVGDVGRVGQIEFDAVIRPGFC